MREHDIERIVKGYRDEKDLEWERYQAEYNMLHGGYATEMLECREEMKGISSTLVRERLANGESIDGLVPDSVRDFINEIIQTERTK